MYTLYLMWLLKTFISFSRNVTSVIHTWLYKHFPCAFNACECTHLNQMLQIKTFIYLFILHFIHVFSVFLCGCLGIMGIHRGVAN